jgi:hypothetical protein
MGFIGKNCINFNSKSCKTWTLEKKIMQAFILEKKILHGNFSSPALRVFLMVRPLASEISGDLTKEIDIDNNLNNYSPKAR